MNKQAHLVLDVKNTLGEGPWWDVEKQILTWVDILEKQIHGYSPERGSCTSIKLDQCIGALVPTTNGQMICAMQHGFYRLNPLTGITELICDPEAALPDNRFNDGKCDGAGRFWAGTMNFDGIGTAGSLYCLDPVTGCSLKLSNIGISNGIAWSLDQQTMYYIDTPTREIVAFPFDLATGVLGEKETVIRIPEQRGFPDGMTIDAEGMLWVALARAGQVARWNPATGECLETVEVPASLVTSCTFGGEGLDELYITSARVGLDASALNKEPLAGGLFRVKTGTRGLPVQKYGRENN